MKLYHLYHGTSFENGQSIIANGFGISNEKDTIWTCSDKNYTYCIKKSNDEEQEQGFDENFDMAIQAAKTAAAFYDSKSKRIIVFEFEMDETVFDANMIGDDSCENMIDCFEIESSELNKLIAKKDIRVKTHIIDNGYSPHLRPFYLIFCPKTYFNSSSLEPDLEDIIDLLKNSNDVNSIVEGIIYDYGEDSVEAFPVQKDVMCA